MKARAHSPISNTVVGWVLALAIIVFAVSLILRWAFPNFQSWDAGIGLLLVAR